MQMMVVDLFSHLIVVFFLLCVYGYGSVTTNKIKTTETSECSNVTVCISPEMEKALNDDDVMTICVLAGGAVNCIDVFISRCEHSHQMEKNIFKEIRKELIRMRNSLTRNCQQFTIIPTPSDFPSKTMGCDPAAMAACSSKMSSNPDMNNLEPYCKSIQEAKQCAMAEIDKCPDGAAKNQMKQQLAGFDQAAQLCGGDKCSMVKVSECQTGMMSFTNKTGNMKSYCTGLAKAKMCVEKILPHCKNENIKKAIKDIIKGMKQSEKECAKSGNQSGNEGNSASSLSQSAFLSVVLMFIVNLVGGQRNPTV